jgi:hypothetical protein
MLVGEFGGNGVSKSFRHGHILSVASVSIAAGSPEFSAEVFLTGLAVFTVATGRKYPGHPYPITGLKPGGFTTGFFYSSHHLMAQYDG